MRVGAGILERQHGNPEPFISPGYARVSGDVAVYGKVRDGCRPGAVSRHIAKLVAHVTCGLHAMAWILFEAAPDDAGKIGREVGAHITDRGRSIAQDR